MPSGVLILYQEELYLLISVTTVPLATVPILVVLDEGPLLKFTSVVVLYCSLVSVVPEFEEPELIEPELVLPPEEPDEEPVYLTR